eukprot:gnl/MRDRNA2_/MRDRNA2_281957_c0_seq1.p1 gnl/MRDRNA2_/MRDRNA2_281957_c0~~gnl/MRDRNA2_/MRDRNA2_281957_c0_seq1.p1  ORF type:complete len:126 (-),score=34.54 gnl/MRDRNA2_/MRDRNA2_281957_c0_seq1:91-468(-)
MLDKDGDGEVNFLEFMKDKDLQLFLQIDENGQGRITREKLGKALKSMDGKFLSITEEDLDELWNTIDSNGDGEVDFKEFMSNIDTLKKLKARRIVQSQRLTDMRKSAEKSASKCVSPSEEIDLKA